MAHHEVDCIREKLGMRELNIETHNAVIEPAQVDWLNQKHLLLIGGSGDFSVHHPLSRPWVEPLHPVLERAISDGIHSLAICFGHQLLGEHLGSQVITDPARAELGTVGMSLTPAGQIDPLFSVLSPSFNAHCGHSDLVSHVPERVELMASNQTLDAQGFKVRGTPFYSVQFHPDMTGSEARERYMAYHGGFSEKLSQDARAYADSFRPGEDEACSLLDRLAALAVEATR